MKRRVTSIDRMSAVQIRERVRWLVAGLTCGLAMLTVLEKAHAQSSPSERLANRTEDRGSAREHPLIPALRFARVSHEAVQRLKDYKATFSKREMLGGTMQMQQMSLKLREQPFSVYVNFKEPNAGREVIFVAGKNDGKLLAHDTGIKSLVGTIALDPNSTLAMAGNRYPITMIGMKNLIEAVIAQWESETKIPDVQVRYFPNSKLGNLECKVIESTHAEQRDGVKFSRTRLYLTKPANLPVRVEQFGFPSTPGADPPLVEEYTYADLQTDIGLTDTSFSTDNPEYDF